MKLEAVAFEGHDCIRLEGDGSTLFVTTSVGPRVLGLVAGEGNVFAALPDDALDGPGGLRFRLLGGHRLWVAPEVPELTYQPDERPCAVAQVEGGVRVEAPPDAAGVVKSMEVREASGGWIVDHAVRNGSSRTILLAPWAITQLRLGGEVELPIGSPGTGPRADRAVVLWPYTDLADPRVRFETGMVRIEARAGGPTQKLGAAPGEGWLRYRLGGEVFEKRTDVDPAAEYPDRGAASQVFLCDRFVELETLGPLGRVEPDGWVTHRERWTLVRADELEPGARAVA